MVNVKLQLMYLGVSLVSTFCSMTNFHTVICSNMVGLMCLVDLYFVKKIDMLLHHLLVLCLVDSVNKEYDITNRNEIISTVLSTEISTIFLTTNNLLEIACNRVVIKNINKLFFVSTFAYYRIYNYYFILDISIFKHFDLYVSIYGMFILAQIFCFIALFIEGNFS